MAAKITASKVSDPADMETVFAIRHKVFVEEQNCPPELERDKEEQSTHFLAKVGGVAAGASRWRKTDHGYKLERFAVLKEYRGMGVGQELVKAVLNDLPTDAGNIYMHAQLQAVPLYEKFNFKKVGAEFEEAGIRHFKMTRDGV